MNRELILTDDMQTHTVIRSSEPVVVYEFSAQKRTARVKESLCTFAQRVNNKTRYDEISSLGLWLNGTYISSRALREKQTVSLTDIDATGMVSLSKGTDTKNQTQRERSFVAGHMNISEAVEYEEGI